VLLQADAEDPFDPVSLEDDDGTERRRAREGILDAE
jgi:hypothetical protein